MILGIDTCGPTGTIALAKRDGSRIVLLGQTELAGKTYSAMLTPKLAELLETHGAAVHQMEAIVAVHGPGSFTGVRVGVSAAKGLAEALNIPIVAVSRLEVLMHKAKTSCAILDAGRGEFYFGDATGEALVSPGEVPASDANLAVCEEKAALAFPGAKQIHSPTAADAIDFSLSRLSAGDFDDPATLDGNYLRRSDAELFSKQKQGTLNA